MSRLIDADATPSMGISNFSVMFRKVIDEMPTVDLWHYPSKGELPDKDGEYLCRYYKYGIRFSKVARYRVKDNKWYHLIYDAEYRIPKPDAWQEIILPEKEI